MREIKFRAWHPENMQFYYFSLRNYMMSPEDAQEELCPSDCEEIQQFTGLHDKNGKEIYEGDIVIGKYNHDGDIRTSDPMKLVWGSSAWGLEYASGNSAPSIHNWISLEVIGNIYENPELVEPRP